MIRFVDKEIMAVKYDRINRWELLRYFLDDHLDCEICVVDSRGLYLGIITYHSLLCTERLDDSIAKEHVILDKDIWKNARQFFSLHSIDYGDQILLPVVDKQGKLISFAYEDFEANREVRILRELQETANAMQFVDIFPQYKCVKIYGFNELAFLFAEYLKKQGIFVQVDGSMWDEISYQREGYDFLDYNCMIIYADGIGEKPFNWKENLLRSASVEFECIDDIYEANIKKQLIKDTTENCESLFARLRDKRKIIILGEGRNEQNAYGFLRKNGIEVCCFVSAKNSEWSQKLFGKEIISEQVARRMYKDAIYIDCVSRNSTWGSLKIDYYDYIGYNRNEKYILIQDYSEIPENSLIYALKNMNVVLAGDTYFCRRLYHYLKQSMVSVIGHLHILPDNIELQGLPKISIDDIDDETECLIVLPDCWMSGAAAYVGKEKRQKIITYFQTKKISNYTDYYTNTLSLINIEEEEKTEYTKKWMMPKRIVLGSIEAYSGNVFFKGLLDNHPNILLIHFSDLNNCLFWICFCLAKEDSADILPLLWKIIGKDSDRIYNPKVFNETMMKLLSFDDKFTSQELFIMFHIAYASMDREIQYESGIQNMIIYWEPHFLDRDIMENCVKWLGTKKVPCDIINIVRDICTHNGAIVKRFIKKFGVKAAYNDVFSCPNIDKKKYIYSNRWIYKFEELKCNPRENLAEICNKWGILWSDTLMRVTQFGKEWVFDNGVRMIKDFDLEPVYNTYEDYLTEFDRLRIILINAPWQKKYGYPFVKLSNYSRRELQELFLKKFYFDKFEYQKVYQIDLDFQINLQYMIRSKLQYIRMVELLW